MIAALTVPSFPPSARPAETTCQLETALGQLLSDATYSLSAFDLGVCVSGSDESCDPFHGIHVKSHAC